LAEFHAATIKANARAHGARTEIDDALATMKASMGLGAPDAQPLDVHLSAGHDEHAQQLSKKERKAQKKAERQARRSK
jgi:hypothetical protein